MRFSSLVPALLCLVPLVTAGPACSRRPRTTATTTTASASTIEPATTSSVVTSMTGVLTTSITSSKASTLTTTASSTTQPTTPVTTTTTLATAMTSTTSSAQGAEPTDYGSSAHVDNVNGLSWYNPLVNVGTTGRSPPSSGYVCFKGPSSNFPPMSTWISFENMWNLMAADALGPIGDSAAEQQDILNAINQVSNDALVDPRVILAVIIDESTGNVRVGCTFNGVENCGLMQSYDPTDKTYDPNNAAASILQMIVDGTQGTAAGPGLVQHLNEAASGPGDLWTALRLYNSGSANTENLSDGRGATPAYVSNIANFLQGWNGYGEGPKNCDFSV